MNKKEIFDKMIEKADSTRQRLFLSAAYLFSTKGYSSVGIRELCGSLHLKESAFYNHYRSKEALLTEIIGYFADSSREVVLSAEEIDAIVEKGDIGYFLEMNLKKFSAVTGNPLYQTILQIVLMESYTNPLAYEAARQNLYYLRKDYTEKALRRLMDMGAINACDPAIITAEYYYGLKGLLDEYLFHEVWNEDTRDINRRIGDHIAFFTALLRPGSQPEQEE